MPYDRATPIILSEPERAELEASIQACIAATNADPKPLRRTKPADDILAAVQRFGARTLSTHAGPARTEPQAQDTGTPATVSSIVRDAL